MCLFKRKSLISFLPDQTQTLNRTGHDWLTLPCPPSWTRGGDWPKSWSSSFSSRRQLQKILAMMASIHCNVMSIGCRYFWCFHFFYRQPFYSSRSPNPLKIYQKVFIDIATKYSKQQKRFLSSTKNWGKRSDTKKEVEHSMPNQLDNKIFNKRIWLEEKEKNVNALEPKKDDVIRSRISYIHRADQIRRRFLYDMFSHPQPLKPVRSDAQNLMPMF